MSTTDSISELRLILDSMRESESESSITHMNHLAAFLPYRPYLRKTVRILVHKARLSTQVYFLALNYIDEMLSRALAPKNELILAATCALYLAGTVRFSFVVPMDF